MGLAIPSGQTPPLPTPVVKSGSTPRVTDEEPIARREESGSDFKDRARKRQSRLGTSQYLAPKKEISASERVLVLKQGFVRWSSPCKRPFGGKV